MAELSTPPPESVEAPKHRKVWRRLAIGVGILIAMVILIIGALQTPPARRYILSKVTTLLAAEDITFSAENFRYNLLDLSTNLQNVRIKSSGMPDAPAFLEIDRARI